MRHALYALAFAGFTAASAAGQTYGRVEETRSNVGTYFYHVLPGEATVRAYVWGTVLRPGLYEVGAQTDLGALLTLAGGPALTTHQATNRRDVFIRLYREESGERRLTYETELAQLVLEPAAYPMLRDGDVVLVEIIEQRGFHWRDMFSVMAGLAALALAAERFIAIAR